MQKKILVIKLSALGDFIIALAPMAAIRRHHPDAHITLMTTKLFKDMAGRSGYFDCIKIVAKPRWYQLGAWADLARWLNREKFSRVYDLQMNDRTAILFRLFLKKPEWSGVVLGASHVYANRDWRNMHALERHRAVLEVAGIENVPLPDITWMETDISLFSLKKPYVLLVPGSAPQHPQKRWPALRYGALARKLQQEGFEVAVLGTDAEREVVQRIVTACPGVRDLSGKTSLYDIATLGRGAAACVGNDTGPTHLIALSGCPVVVLFSGASNPEHSAPVGDVTVIQSDDLADVNVEVVFKNLRPRQAA